MTIQELYGAIGGNYDHAVQIMKKDKMINKYLLKLTDSGLYEGCKDAVESMDPTRIFEAAHAMKGVCANLGLDNLAEAVGELTEEFRPGAARKYSDDEVRAMWDKVDGIYAVTAEGINSYKESL
jgi:HPt (histidine-containing phosphotransfer) domain-containing protein